MNTVNKLEKKNYTIFSLLGTWYIHITNKTCYFRLYARWGVCWDFGKLWCRQTVGKIRNKLKHQPSHHPPALRQPIYQFLHENIISCKFVWSVLLVAGWPPDDYIWLGTSPAPAESVWELQSCHKSFRCLVPSLYFVSTLSAMAVAVFVMLEVVWDLVLAWSYNSPLRVFNNGEMVHFLCEYSYSSSTDIGNKHNEYNIEFI